jgi:sugar phosphate isomerase/epimerase
MTLETPVLKRAPLVSGTRQFVPGAATNLADLPLNLEWFVEGDRDIEFGDPIDPSFLDSPERQAVFTRTANELLANHNGRRGIHGPFQGIPTNSPDPLIREVVSKRFIQALEFTSTFGGTHMVIHSPFHSWRNPFLFFGAGSDLPKAISGVQATLDPVLPVAERYGITLVIENIFDLSAFPILETVKAIGSPNVRMSLDVGHCQLHTFQGGMTPDQYVLEAGDYLEHLHLQDVDGESDRHWTPGDGIINFRALLEALRQVNGSPRMILELKNKQDVPRGGQFLQDLGYGL